MFEKFRNDPNLKDKGLKAAAVLIIIGVILLSFDVFTQNTDGRSRIIDEDGGTEARLCSILSDINGVGDVDVMLQYNEDKQISGVIVTAQGAADPVVQNNLVKAVMAVFNISASNVEVFEKKAVNKEEEVSDEK